MQLGVEISRKLWRNFSDEEFAPKKVGNCDVEKECWSIETQQAVI